MRCGTLSHDSVCDINPLKFRTGQKEMKPFFSKVCHTHRIHKMRNNDRTTLWVPFLFHHYPPEWHLICPNTSLTSWTTYSSIPGHFESHRKWNWSNSTKNRLKRITYALVCTCPEKVDPFYDSRSLRGAFLFSYIQLVRNLRSFDIFHIWSNTRQVDLKNSSPSITVNAIWRKSL